MSEILIIDDDESICRIFSRAVSRMDHQADYALTLGSGLEKIREKTCDLVLLDVGLPDGNGLEAVPDILKAPGEPEVIIITGQGDADGAEMATRSGAWAYVEKPPVMDQLTLHIRRALQFREQKNIARRPLIMKREEIIGSSPAITRCLEHAALASASDVNVLLTGETGTGKELFARAIHRNSRRSGEKFVPVDCAALIESLAESILFGHVKGAFTGADRDRRGLIREADGGTLFLDEVGELSLELQKSFLRVLQEKRVRPVGSEKEIECRFRLIAATNRDPDKMIEQKIFRSDLLYRINAFPIRLPPLRERDADFRELAGHFIQTFCKSENIETKSVSPDFFETLAAYSWPGNVRELTSAIESAVSMARFAPMLYSRHLPEEIRVHQARQKVDGSAFDAADRNISPVLPTLKKFRDSAITRAEKNYLTDLVQAARGSAREACLISGLSRSRLYTLLKQYDIQLK